MSNTTNIIINQPASNGAEFKESVDLGLVCAAFEHQVNLIFVDLGVFNLLKKQNASLVSDKNHADILKGLEFYDIENLYVEKESLSKTGYELEDLIESVQIINAQEIAHLNSKANSIIAL